MSMNNLVGRATASATEPGPQACGHIKPWQAESRIRIAPRFWAALSGGEFRDVLQKGRCKVSTLVAASPELKRLWIRALKRVLPDLPVEEQDRRRCDWLTQQANDAYAGSDEVTLGAVLEPKAPRLMFGKHWQRLNRRRHRSQPLSHRWCRNSHSA